MRSLTQVFCRYFLRFLCFYWICFTLPFPLELVGIPFRFIEPQDQPAWMYTAGEGYGAAYLWIYNQKTEACKWVGAHILDVEVIIQPTGSGDTMRAYVGCFCGLIIAAVAAFLWTLILFGLGRFRPQARPDVLLLALVRLQVRFFLVLVLFGYGFVKVFPLQFSPPSSFRLAEQVGDMSPMGLLWTFMGFSPAYEIFTGAIEVLGGVLLTTRRTTLLGALVATAAMTQVFVLNMCFDVPVKLYSFHYLVMAVFLAAPELPRLVNVLVLGRAVAAMRLAPLLGSVGFDRVALAFRTLLVAAMLAGQILSGYRQWQATYGGEPLPLSGKWEVISMRVANEEPGDTSKWTWLDFTTKTIVRISGPTPPPLVYRMTWSAESKELTLARAGGPVSATLSYDLPEPHKLELRGSLDGKAIVATLQRAPEKSYPLMNRDFHWIQELPYNR
jgi:hypothetical protein